jgi:flagellar biogenesis protein FliO
MKKYFLQALLLFSSLTAIAQDGEQHSGAYNFGYKYAIPIIIAVIALIIFIIWLVMKKKKTPPPSK